LVLLDHDPVFFIDHALVYQDRVDDAVHVHFSLKPFVLQKSHYDCPQVHLCVIIEDIVDDEAVGSVGQPFPDKGFQEGEEVHEIEPVDHVDEDEVEVEAAHVADLLEELLYPFGARLSTALDDDVVLEVFGVF
jgi:hypothetical protein